MPALTFLGPASLFTQGKLMEVALRELFITPTDAASKHPHVGRYAD